MKLTTITRRLRGELSELCFADPVTHVYNALDYAWQPHLQYLRRFGQGHREIVLVGMNPGPWGMAQTGIPFGDVELVRDWLGIEGPTKRPDPEHPKRPVDGFACKRREVSGSRLWGWAKGTFGTPDRFFERFFVTNYCPLSFMEDSGRNRTPDKLPAAERELLYPICDAALKRIVETLRPVQVIGIGRFAADRAKIALAELDVKIGVAPHPSPANPQANRGWEPLMNNALAELGIKLPKDSH